jgi:hypothetical protein
MKRDGKQRLVISGSIQLPSWLVAACNLTGHQDGLIGANLYEADDAEREKLRLTMGENHLHHESSWCAIQRDLKPSASLLATEFYQELRGRTSLGGFR